MPILGAHVKVNNGLPTCVDRARELGAECLQIFVGAPQQWKETVYADDQVARLRTAIAEQEVGPVFIHAPYLINLASPKPQLRAMSRQALERQLKWSDRIGAVGVVVHVGSGAEDALDLASESLNRLLAAHTGPSAIILENDAGAGRRIGRTLDQLGELIRRADGDERLRVCLDTAHTLASGYEIRTPEGLEAVLDEFEREIGFDRLTLAHANDSKVDINTHKDRHENIGDGFIGAEAFARIVQHPRFATTPFILEVPGLLGQGPDRENLCRLRGLLNVGEVARGLGVAAGGSDGRRRSEGPEAPG